MTPNEVIYHIKQDRKFSEMWSAFARDKKEDVLKKMENLKSFDLEKVLIEVKTGQNRLF